MIRHAILASLLAAVGCIDQGQPSEVGTTDQAVCGTCSPSVVPIPWSARVYTSVWDYWAPPPASSTVVSPNLQMVAFVVNGEPAVLDPVSGAQTSPATRMVWLISNRGVFRVYEVPVGQVADMEQLARNSFTIVENGYAAEGFAAPGSTIIVGVDGGVVVPKGGGTPHGFPPAVVDTMVGYANVVRPVIINVQDVGANSL
jgi:hypothetical protein